MRMRSQGRFQSGDRKDLTMRAVPAETEGADCMTEDKGHVITLKVNAEGIPQELEVDGGPLLIAPDQLEQGNDLLDLLTKAAGMVFSLQGQTSAKGGNCRLINGKWVCT